MLSAVGMAGLPLVAWAFVVGVLASGGSALVAAIAGLLLVTVVLVRRVPLEIRTLGLASAAFCAGVCRGREIPALVPRPRLRASVGMLAGRVIEGCRTDGDSALCVVERSDRSRVLLRASVCDAEPGDRLRAIATIEPIAPSANGARAGPGASLLRRGIVERGTAANCERATGPPRIVDVPRRIAGRLRRAIVAGLERAMGAEAAGRARALLFGDESAVDRDVIETFRSSGLAHLLAVSGAHVALVAGALGALARALLRRVRSVALRGWVVPWSAALPIPALALFVLATGESASAVRAFVGATLSAIALCAGRRPRGASVVAASALITAAAMPAYVLDVGWQLSIVASWALVSSTRAPHSRTLSGLRSVLSIWQEAAVSTTRVGLAVAPVLAWHFQQMPVAALAANVLAAPLAETIALPAVLVTGLLGFAIPVRITLVGQLVDALLVSLFALPARALALPGATLVLPPPTPAQAVVLVTAAVLFLGATRRGRWIVVVVAVLLVGGIECLHRVRAQPHGVLRVTAIDVGQGDSILVDLPDGAAMLIDAGGSRSPRYDPGARIVVPFLADRRRRHLAVAVASHPHPDHIGGMPAVLAWGDVDEFWDTRQGESFRGPFGAYGRLRAALARSRVVVRGPEVLCGPGRAFHGAWLEVLAPCPTVSPGTPPNDASFVLRITFGRAVVLLPGDLEQLGESRVLGALGPVTLLKVGHHGSRTSSSEAFLDRLSPRVAIASAGNPSPFDHPSPEILARFAARGVPLLTTARDGAVSVVLHQDGTFEVER